MPLSPPLLPLGHPPPFLPSPYMDDMNCWAPSNGQHWPTLWLIQVYSDVSQYQFPGLHRFRLHKELEHRGPGIFSHVREVKGRKVVKRTSLNVSALGLRRAKRAFCSESFFSHRHWPNTSACCYTFYGQVVATSKYGVWTLGTLNRDVWINQVFE